MSFNKITKGFTLVEIVVVLAILVLIVVFSVSSFKLLNQSQALSKSADLVATTLREARSQTLASKSLSQYGVHFDPTQIVLFKGDLYSATATTNLYFPLNSSVSISNIALSGGRVEVIYSRLTGDAPQTGTVTLSLVSNPSSIRTINISGSGLVEVSP